MINGYLSINLKDRGADGKITRVYEAIASTDKPVLICGYENYEPFYVTFRNTSDGFVGQAAITLGTSQIKFLTIVIISNDSVTLLESNHENPVIPTIPTNVTLYEHNIQASCWNGNTSNPEYMSFSLKMYDTNPTAFTFETFYKYVYDLGGNKNVQVSGIYSKSAGGVISYLPITSFGSTSNSGTVSTYRYVSYIGGDGSKQNIGVEILEDGFNDFVYSKVFTLS